MAYAKKRAAPTKKVTRKRAKGTSTKLVKLIKKVAAAEAHKQIEDKQQSLDYGLTVFNNASSGTGDQLRVFPAINLGVNSADRLTVR